MAITHISRDWGSEPALVRITTTDNLTSTEASNYILNQADNIIAVNNGEFSWNTSDCVLVYASNGWGLYSISSDFSSLNALFLPYDYTTPYTRVLLNSNSFDDALSTLGFVYGTTDVWGGGSTTHTFSAPGVIPSDILTANILSSTVATTALTRVQPDTDSIIANFTADPGGNTVLRYISISDSP